MIADLEALRNALARGHVPPVLCAPIPETADKCERISLQLEAKLTVGRAAVETVDQIRRTLVAHGALLEGDQITDIAALIGLLLPPSGKG